MSIDTKRVQAMKDLVGVDFESKATNFSDMIMMSGALHGFRVHEASSKNWDGAAYFESDDWMIAFMQRHNFVPAADEYVAFDREAGVPVGRIHISPSDTSGFVFTITAKHDIIVDLADECIRNVRVSFDGLANDTRFPAKTIVGFVDFPFGGRLPRIESTPMLHNRVVHDEYYPSMLGGPVGLIRSFMESSATVLILSGPPGTGKTSAIAYAARKLNLLPTYATNLKVIIDTDFIKTIFSEQDRHFSSSISEGQVSARSALFSNMMLAGMEKPFARVGAHINKLVNDEIQQRTGFTREQMTPVSVVEDADILLRPRDAGNEQMSELLNYTDGATGGKHRKIIFTTNLERAEDIEPALLRVGRCFGMIDVRRMALSEANTARRKSGLSPIVSDDKKKMWTLAEVLNHRSKSDNDTDHDVDGGSAYFRSMSLIMN